MLRTTWWPGSQVRSLWRPRVLPKVPVLQKFRAVPQSIVLSPVNYLFKSAHKTQPNCKLKHFQLPLNTWTPVTISHMFLPHTGFPQTHWCQYVLLLVLRFNGILKVIISKLASSLSSSGRYQSISFPDPNTSHYFCLQLDICWPLYWGETGGECPVWHGHPNNINNVTTYNFIWASISCTVCINTT